jgi:hypothetical protein
MDIDDNKNPIRKGDVVKAGVHPESVSGGEIQRHVGLVVCGVPQKESD